MLSARICTAAYAGIWKAPSGSRLASLKAFTMLSLPGSLVKSAGSVTSRPSMAGPAMATRSWLAVPSGPMNWTFKPCSRAWRSSRPSSGW
ncbi:hypothetical protein G6F64_015527 [Rhizopus arrhizus]|uniref:Uncharacterized protein n=1 Tax=Rhizopus oryzae TaxID=64495 RepID=A0A9P7BIJ6_RHIOR|nr:hypothetical protein G6F64_015527 [Rhizopus arrhizus]